MEPEQPAGAPPPPSSQPDPALPDPAAPDPGATAPAPAAPAWPTAAPMASAPLALGRPGAITAASIILIIFGVILGLLGLLVMLGGALFPAIKDSPELAGQLGSVPESFGTFILVIGTIMSGLGHPAGGGRHLRAVTSHLGTHHGHDPGHPGRPDRPGHHHPRRDRADAGGRHSSRCCSWAATPLPSGRWPARGDGSPQVGRADPLADVQGRVLARAALQHAEQHEGQDRIDAADPELDRDQAADLVQAGARRPPAAPPAGRG